MAERDYVTARPLEVGMSYVVKFRRFTLPDSECGAGIGPCEAVELYQDAQVWLGECGHAHDSVAAGVQIMKRGIREGFNRPMSRIVQAYAAGSGGSGGNGNGSGGGRGHKHTRVTFRYRARPVAGKKKASNTRQSAEAGTVVGKTKPTQRV